MIARQRAAGAIGRPVYSRSDRPSECDPPTLLDRLRKTTGERYARHRWAINEDRNFCASSSGGTGNGLAVGANDRTSGKTARFPAVRARITAIDDHRSRMILMKCLVETPCRRVPRRMRELQAWERQ
jgi:hypothetical protein